MAEQSEAESSDEKTDGSQETTEETGEESSGDENLETVSEPEETAGDPDPDGVKFTIRAGTLSNVIEYVTCLVDECRVDLDPHEGLSISSSDPANVAMTTPSLQPAAFESYSADGYIGMNIERLEDIIGMAGKDDLVTVELDQQTRKLDISFDGLSYTMALIDPESIQEEPDIPDLDLSSEVFVEASDLSRGIKAADMVSDHILLSTDSEDETFHIQAEGDTDDTDLELGDDELIDISAGDVESLFSLDYLKDMLGPIDKDAEVRMELGEEFPVKIHTEFAEGLGSNTFLLAPRITSD